MVHEKYRSCIDACYACAVACDHCAVACLGESNPKPMAECIRLDIDCADICRMAAAYMARDSAYAARIRGVCADICEACGTECDRFEHGHCKECAEACRRCAEECRRMAA